MWEARPIKKIPLSEYIGPKVAFFHANSGIGLKNNFGYIPRPPEAISSFKSLFEGVPEGLQSSYFVWRAKMRKYYHLETSAEAVRALFQSEAARGHSSSLGPPRPPYMVLKWLPLASGCQIWPRPRMASSDLERPRNCKSVLWPQKWSYWHFSRSKIPTKLFFLFFCTFICEKVNKQLKYNLNPILRVFLKAY